MAPADGGARLALVGAASTLGREVKEALAAGGVSGDLLDLLDLDEQVGLVTDYGDEARAVLEATVEQMRDHEVVCFAGEADTTRRFAPSVAEAGGIAIDCVGACAGHREALLAATGSLPVAAEHRGAILLVPHPATQLLQRLADALGERMQRAVVTLLLPATEATARGAEALAAEAAALLNFEDAPEGVFGRRLAFDLWPEHGQETARRVRHELAALELPLPALAALRVPVFHGLSASAWIDGIDAHAARDALRGAGIDIVGAEATRPPVDSPARATGRGEPTLGAVHELPGQGVFLWLLLDNHQAIAQRAVALALTLLEQGQRA